LGAPRSRHGGLLPEPRELREGQCHRTRVLETEADPLKLTLSLLRDADGYNPLIPHTQVLEPNLVVHKLYNGYWSFGRPSAEERSQDLRAVLRKCRPEWGITAPELRAAWERADKTRFYPYGKSRAQIFKEQGE